MKNDNYSIDNDYHGDIKIVRKDTPMPVKEIQPLKNTKKVDLSKPTDNNIKPIVNLNTQTNRVLNKRNSVCLTKPESIQQSIPKSNNISSNVNSSNQPSIKYKSVKRYDAHILKNIVKIGLAVLTVLSIIITLCLTNINAIWLIPMILIILLILVSPISSIAFIIAIIYYKLKIKSDVWGDYSDGLTFSIYMEILSLIGTMLFFNGIS